MLNFFSVAVKQTGVYVHITGVSYWNLAKDIEKFYSTSLITKYMVRRETWDTIKVHNFFLVELHFILNELLKVRNLRSRRRELSELKHLLETETWIKDTVNPAGQSFDFKKLSRFVHTPFAKQREFLEQYPIIRNSYHLKGLLLDSVPGSGKAMPLNTMVKTPTGWTRLGDLKIGDQVIGPKGNTANVTGYFPQGVTENFRFTFEDGRTAESHPLHLWEVYEDDPRSGGYVTTTQDIVGHFDQFRYYLPLVDEVGGNTDVSNHDLSQLALNLTTSGIAIGESVMELSYTERFEICRRMLELSGAHVSETGVVLLSENAVAASNFQKLIWSLGGIANLDVSGSMNKVEFKHRNMVGLVDGLIGDSLANIVDLSGYEDLKLKIVSFEQLASVETACISIDSEDMLYIVDNWVVTHNTFTSLMWSELVNDHKTVVFCPLNIVDEVWVGQINHHYKVPPRVWTSKSGRLLTDEYDYYIVHYDYIQGDGYAAFKRWIEELARVSKKPPKLIIDESHNLNELKAKRTRRVIELADAKVFSDVLPMSGTPFKALGSEAFPTLCFIDKHFDKIAREFFLASYGRNRAQLLTMLSHRIGRGKFSIPELAGLGDPPPFEIIKVKVPNSDRYTLDAIRLEMQSYIAERVRFYNQHMKEFETFYNEVVQRYEYSVMKNPREYADLQTYKTIVNRFRTKGYNSFTDSGDSVFCKKVEEDIERGLRGAELSEFRNVKSAVKYLGLKLRGEALGNVLGRARINAIKDMIEHAELPKYIDDVEKKTVVFTSYVDVLKLSLEYLVKQGYQPVSVFGENSKDRDRAVAEFGKDPKLNPLVAVYDSLKEGFPLLMANQILSLNAPFRDYEVKQVQARIWRTGQDAAQCFFRLFDLDTGDKLNITTRSIDILAWSREQVDALMGRSEGHALFNEVSGQEMLEVSDEPFTRVMKRTNSVLTLF